MLLNFPAGLTEFTGPDGVKHKPDANGQVEVAAGNLGPFLAYGFMPDVLALAATVSALTLAVAAQGAALAGDIGTLAGRVGGHDTDLGTLDGRADDQDDLLDLLQLALNGDLVFVVSPAALSSPARGTAWQRTVTVTLKTAAGAVHTWFNRTIANGASIADSSQAGTASLASADLVFVNGVAEVVINGDAQDWLDTETDTLTVAQASILGHTVAAKTSVQTFSGLAFTVTPATVNTPATAAAWQRTVTVTLKNALGVTQDWFSEVIANGLTIADNSVAGTASIASPDLTFVAGVAEVAVNGDAAAWLENDTDTLTVLEATILGLAVATKTSVETFTA